jgi:hypothetical protein
MSVKAANYAIRFCGLQDVAAKMVLTTLAWKSDQATPHLAYMSNEQLREQAGLKSVNGLKETVRRLVAAGELRVLRVGGRNLATEYELSGYLRHAETAEVSPSDISDYDSKVSPNDTNRQITTVKCRHLTPKDKDNNKTERQSADAPAPAISSPSLPSSSERADKPKRATAPKFDPASIPLPHGAGFQKWWLHFIEHRASPIKGRRNPLTPLAAKIILGELSAVNEQQAVESIKKCIAAGWVKPFPPEPPQKPTIVELPPQGRPKQTALERSLAEMREQFEKENAA